MAATVEHDAASDCGLSNHIQPRSPNIKRIARIVSCLILSMTVFLGFGATPAQASSWRACQLLDSPKKTLRTFDRLAGPGFAAGKAVLTCGRQGWPGESGWGFRHIRYRHQRDWSKIGTMVGGTWEGVADWAMAQALSGPASVSYDKERDTYLYKTQIHIYDRQGRLQYVFYSCVAVARKSNSVITAFPSDK